jgi:hypothetical protein
MKISTLFTLCGLVGLIAFAPIVRAGDRLPIRSKLRVKEITTGRVLNLPARKGFTIEVAGQANDKSILHIFDANGSQLQGEFQVSEVEVPEDMKGEIAAVLKASSRGATVKVPGCCDVSDPKPEPAAKKDPPEPKNPTRGPAIAPGTKIIYADEGEAPKGQLGKPAPSPPRVMDKFPEPVGLSPVSADRGRTSRGPAILKREPVRPVARDEVAEEPVRAPSSGGICSAYRSFRAKGVPDAPLRQALYFLEKAKKNGTIQKDSRYVGLSDYSQNSRHKRFYLLDLEKGTVIQEKVSHGGGKNRRGVNVGDPDHDGMLNKCGTESGTNLTRAGFFRVGDYYFKNKGRFGWPLLSRRPPRNGVRLHGLSPGANDGAMRDGVVMHEARYNSDDSRTPMGRSYGCPAFAPGKGAPLIKKLVDDESLMYSYAPQCGEQMAPVMKQVEGWRSFCN